MYQQSAVSSFKNLQRIARLLSAPSNGLSAASLQAATEALGEISSSDRCQLLRIDESDRQLSVVAEYRAERVSSMLGRKFPFDGRLLPENLPQTFTGKCPALRINQNNEPAVFKEFLTQSGDRHVVVPVYSNNQLNGFLSLHRSSSEHYADDVVELVEAIAAEMSNSGNWSSSRSADEQADTLTRQLAVERSVRYVVNKLHSSLDKNNILQAAVDSAGHLLKASACMIVRTDATNGPVVSHEYVRADISPLGLGGTWQIPPRLISKFQQRTATAIETAESDDGGYSWLGTPLIVQGSHFGVLLLRGESWRAWQAHEIQLLEAVAQALCISLNNAMAYQELRDQLFNFKIISNLTQQLTAALEQLQRQPPRPAEAQQGEPPPVSVPLSPREMEVLKLIAGGLANREIAQRLFLTESTVELHASRIRKKLKLKSRTALVKFACDNNLV